VPAGLLLALVLLPAAAVRGQPEAVVRRYDVEYEVRIVPTERSAHLTLRVTDPEHGLLGLRFAVDPERQVGFRGAGEVSIEERWVAWKPPRGGGALTWTTRIDHARDDRSYDARCTGSWALVRGDDLVPPARVRTEDLAESVARLRLRLPEGWSSVVPFRRLPDGRYDVSDPRRRFDRPVGWMLFGRLGVLRERTAGVQVAIGAPVGHGARRQDQLALLRWTLPQLRKIAPLPERLVIVGATDPMWRGGLSGPRSAFVHASLPLIAEDGTSPLLHEVVHAWMGARAGPGGDWVVEGLAELYSLEALQRSRTLSRRRTARAFERIADKGRGVENVAAPERATNAITARSVGLLRELDGEIRAATGGARSLDDVVRELVNSSEAVSLDHFRSVCERVTGTELSAFFARSELAR
jgi:hypothetical protein